MQQRCSKALIVYCGRAFLSVAMGLVCAIVFLSIAHARAAQPTTAAPDRATKEVVQHHTAQQVADREDRWYIVELMGSRAGWMHSAQTEKNGQVTTATKMQFSLGRGTTAAGITMQSEFVETKEGEPVRMTSVQKMGQMNVEKTYTFTEKDVEIVTVQAGRETKESMPTPEGDWMTPAKAERYMMERFRAGDKTITASTISPEMGLKVVSQTRTGFEPQTVKVDSTDVQVLKTVVETDAAPGVKSVEYLDNDGEMVRAETSIGGIQLIMTRTTREAAMNEKARGPGDNGQRPEIMVRTFIKPSVPIENPRAATSGVFVLRNTKDALPSLPIGASQLVEVLDAKRARVRINMLQPVAASENDVRSAAFLAATPTADHKDEKIIELAERTLKSAPEDKAQRAELLRRAVHSFIREKNLGVAMGTASEVVRTREGDCTEHGVLLVALLRADGIPARGVTGLVYADQFAGEKGIFGYHMWVQALLSTPDGPRWVDLDGTLPDQYPFDATHVALGHSDLSDADMTTSLLNVAQMLGQLEIDVESVEHAADASKAPKEGP
jgi:transglutaminase-like putative cysteine protease